MNSIRLKLGRIRIWIGVVFRGSDPDLCFSLTVGSYFSQRSDPDTKVSKNSDPDTNFSRGLDPDLHIMNADPSH